MTRLGRIAVAVVATVMVLLSAFTLAVTQQPIDRCLDAGGRWDEAIDQCDFGDTTEPQSPYN